MARNVLVTIEHTHRDTYRAILSTDGSVFDVVEATAANLPALLKHCERCTDGGWIGSIEAPWPWDRGSAIKLRSVAAKCLAARPDAQGK